MNDLSKQASDLRNTAAECLQKAAELEHAINNPEPVTACVGDEVRLDDLRGWITTPQSNLNFVTIRTKAAGREVGLDCGRLKTPDGRVIDRVVPYRLRFYQHSSLWCIHGKLSRHGWIHSLGAKEALDAAVKTLWPWYDGPAYIIED